MKKQKLMGTIGMILSIIGIVFFVCSFLVCNMTEQILFDGVVVYTSKPNWFGMIASAMAAYLSMMTMGVSIVLRGSRKRNSNIDTLDRAE